MPKISIIVPVYNVEEYIHRCIDSILAQTFTDFELILINDGSPDQCGKICDEYAKRDSRIKVIHKKNGGLSDARNAGLDIAQGQFIGFVDSDDYIEYNMYEMLLEACNNNQVSISMCGRYDVYGGEKTPLFTLDQSKLWTSNQAIGRLLTWDKIDSSACDKLFRKSLFQNIRFPNGKYNEDIFIIPQLIHSARSIVHIGDPKYNYFHRTDSITTESFSEKKLDLLIANDLMKKFILENYPNHKIRYESFYYNNLIFLNAIIQHKKIKNQNKRSYNLLYRLLLKNLIGILTNPYLSFKSKIKSILIIFKLYSFVESIVKIMNKNKEMIR